MALGFVFPDGFRSNFCGNTNDFKHEKTLREGKLFKFKIAPIDPSDPFRGKSITLNFDAVSWITDDSSWSSRMRCFVLLEEDDGFAKIVDVLKNPPSENAQFVQAKVSVMSPMSRNNQTVNELVIEHPFEQFFLEEHKALRPSQCFLRLHTTLPCRLMHW